MKKSNQSVAVLRLGHRPSRDKRISTHLFLVARAFGAEKGYYTGTQDNSLEESIRKITIDWGGNFTLDYAHSWKAVTKNWEGKIVHLTMYGLPLREVMGEIRARDEILVVVGAEKVPGEIYGLADYNVSVTTQPHSEVSGVAVFLDHLFEGAELDRSYPDAELRIYPSSDGKRSGP